MPSKFRLKRSDFSRTKGFRRVAGRLLSLSYGEIPGRLTPGGACVVSAKVVRSAANRNRVKRRCRALLLPLMNTSARPHVIVCYAKKGVEKATFQELSDDFKNLVRSIWDN